MSQIYQRIANKQLFEKKQEQEREEAEARAIKIAEQAAQEEAALKLVEAIEQVAEVIGQAAEEDEQ